MHLLVRLSVALCLSGGLSFPCSCSPPITALFASANADVVFRGKITDLRELSTGSGKQRYTRRIAVFRVSRVWKGVVGQTFEITAPEKLLCMGSEPSYFKIGNDLLVYAKGASSEYVIPPCSRTALAQNAKDDFDELGLGEEPRQGRKPNSK